MGRKKPSYLSLTDMFCGAGGASIGAEAAGLKLVLGINHWERAIATHQENFPHAKHDCRDVSETHPSRYGSTHLLWASPECPTWSQARGKKRNFAGQLALSDEFEPLPTEAEEKSRVTMWDVVRYTEYHGYDAVVVENVVDLMPWYLLPVWLQAMDTLGYRHRALFLNSMFFGVPQSRDRVYFVFWRKGNRTPDLEFGPRSWCPSCAADVEAVQIWKDPQKQDALAISRYRAQYVYICPSCGREAFPYVMPAAIAIDWSVRGERIGERKRPLAPATMARIQAGIDRYWRPVVMDTLRDPKFRDPESDTLPTQTSRQSLGLAQPPLLAHLRGTHEAAIDSSTRLAGEPMGTVSGGGGHHGLVEPPEPLYVKNFTARGNPAQMVHPVSEPLGSVTAVDHHGLLVHPGSGGPGRVRSTEDPLPTQTTETRPMLVSYYGRKYTARPVGHPMGTLTGDPRHGLLTPAGGTWRLGSTSTDDPMPARTGSETDGLVTQLDMSYRGHKSRRVRPASEPMATVTAKGGENFALVRPPFLAKAAGSTYDPGQYKRVRDPHEDPLWSQTGTNETAVVEAPEAFLSSYYSGSEGNKPVEEPMGTLTAKERHALIEGAEEIDINDCFFRMLMPPEIQLGMAFEGAYIVTGNQREKVKQLGQAVTPPVPAWIWQRIVESLR